MRLEGGRVGIPPDFLEKAPEKTPHTSLVQDRDTMIDIDNEEVKIAKSAVRNGIRL